MANARGGLRLRWLGRMPMRRQDRRARTVRVRHGLRAMGWRGMGAGSARWVRGALHHIHHQAGGAAGIERGKWGLQGRAQVEPWPAKAAALMTDTVLIS